MTPPNNPLIVKKILYAGTKSVNFKEGAKVYFHFQTRLCDEERTLLDDSRKMGLGEPLHIVLGKKFKLEVWEAVIQRMDLNEVATFTVDKNLVLQYPFVSKTIRDVHIPREQRKPHCCAMTLQTEGVGYEDLNNLIKNPVNLEFTIEVLKVEQPDEYEKEVWQMDEEEKLKLIPELRERGNKEFKEKRYEEAGKLYAQAIGMLEQLMLREKPRDTEWNNLNMQKNPLLLNYAQCKLNQNEYYSVIEYCTTVLQSEPDNVKALFRRGKAHVAVWNPEYAKEDFEKVVKLDPSLTSLVKKELNHLDALLKCKNEIDKEKLKNMFK